MSGEMNLSARNTLLCILESKGIQILELEEAIETLYERSCKRHDILARELEEREYQLKKAIWASRYNVNW